MSLLGEVRAGKIFKSEPRLRNRLTRASRNCIAARVLVTNGPPTGRERNAPSAYAA